MEALKQARTAREHILDVITLLSSAAQSAGRGRFLKFIPEQKKSVAQFPNVIDRKLHKG